MTNTLGQRLYTVDYHPASWQTGKAPPAPVVPAMLARMMGQPPDDQKKVVIVARSMREMLITFETAFPGAVICEIDVHHKMAVIVSPMVDPLPLSHVHG